jgi:hypothetical protein
MSSSLSVVVAAADVRRQIAVGRGDPSMLLLLLLLLFLWLSLPLSPLGAG